MVNCVHLNIQIEAISPAACRRGVYQLSSGVSLSAFISINYLKKPARGVWATWLPADSRRPYKKLWLLQNSPVFLDLETLFLEPRVAFSYCFVPRSEGRQKWWLVAFHQFSLFLVFWQPIFFWSLGGSPTELLWHHSVSWGRWNANPRFYVGFSLATTILWFAISGVMWFFFYPSLPGFCFCSLGSSLKCCLVDFAHYGCWLHPCSFYWEPFDGEACKVSGFRFGFSPFSF